MKSKKTLLLLLSILFLIPACKVYFTPELKHHVEIQGVDIKDVQFYNSHTIILQRELTDTVVITDTTNLREVRVLKYRRIKIKRNTPCVCVKDDSLVQEIIFKQGDSSTFKFVLDTMGRRSKYKIAASGWIDGKKGSIVYNDTLYYLKDKRFFFQANPKEASLKVKRRIRYKFAKQLTKLKGVEVGS